MVDNPRLRPADATSTMNRFTMIGERMASDWKSALDEITSLAGYQQTAADTARAVDQC